MIRLVLIVGVAFGLLLGASPQCPTTVAPNPPFVPPFPYRAEPNPRGGFLYGNASLWTRIPISTEVRVPACCPPYGVKLAYRRVGFDMRKEHPELTVVARRLDVVTPLVWAGHAVGVSVPGDDYRYHHDSLSLMSMMTGINLPTIGCWEIAARYKEPTGDFQTLSYVVLLKP
jgi:hypothetical protein